ncbi:TetR/AcrR family transcriptional regulator [Variovorax sp. KBS0712]|uniref:TetR/AcrR family transcriptional regulator n=1 Tax=Variovorax sp. KBS0712 TaxID=2578111 RepID=UPI00163DE66C|nr:TetR family transcriptional regulator [Variovorax sp. KBS0712]
MTNADRSRAWLRLPAQMKKSVQAPGERSSVPGVDRSSPRKAGEVTRERMLDGAEALFAMHGYHGTSMRDVAEATETRIALVTYHFGTKDILFSKVVERRASYLGHQRMRALDAARGRMGGKPVAVADLVAGYVWPFVERSANGGQGWKYYALLVARLANTPDWAKVIGEHFDPISRQYLTEFQRVLDGVDEEVVYHAFSFMVGAMVAIVAEPGRVENLSYGRFKSSRPDQVYKHLLPFLTAGFDAMTALKK